MANGLPPPDTAAARPGPLQSTSPVMLAIDGIDAMIADGRLVPGQRLAEGDLSEDLGIPRGRVREALRILAGQGVVELEPYKSARVRRLPQREITALFETITGLFCTGVVLLSRRFKTLSQPDQAEFKLASERLSSAAREAGMAELVAQMLSYHHLVNRLCGNPHLDAMMSSLHLAHYYNGVSAYVPENMLRSGMSHGSRIGDAVSSGSADATLSLLWQAVAPMISKLDEEKSIDAVRRI